MIGLTVGFFAFRKKDNNKPSSETNLGEQQRQQVREAASQLVGSILDNQNNFNQLTTNPDGSARNIDDIEEIFLSGGVSQTPQSPTQITGSLSFEVIEQTWYELRVFINAGLQNPNQSLIENARLRIRNDIEKWLRWELEKIKGDYNKLLEEYLRALQELKTIRELFEKYCQIRTDLVINKVNKSQELISKGYSEKDVEQLKEWGLLEQDFPNLFDKKRIGATNTLSVSTTETWRGNGKIKEAKKGKTRGLVLILKPHKRENYEVYFPETIEQEQQISVRQLIKDLLDKSQKLGKGAQQNDIYILRTGSKEREGKTGGPSSGIAHYLALYSALHKIPLPRNLGSTGTVEGERVGSIGGLRYKLEASVDNGIDTFILAEKNKKHKNQENSFDDIYPSIESKVKQVHFVSSVKEIEIALNEILNGAIKEKVHVCGKEPIPEKKPEKPERNRDPPINSEITSEQLLSLITELGIREKQGENQDFWEKLQMAYGKNPNYQEAVDQTKNLRQEYLGKLEKIQNNPGGRNPNQGKKIRKFVVLAGTAGGKKEWEEEVGENDKMTCEVCHQQFEDGYTTAVKSNWWCFKDAPDYIRKGEVKVKEEKTWRWRTKQSHTRGSRKAKTTTLWRISTKIPKNCFISG